MSRLCLTCDTLGHERESGHHPRVAQPCWPRPGASRGRRGGDGDARGRSRCRTQATEHTDPHERRARAALAPPSPARWSTSPRRHRRPPRPVAVKGTRPHRGSLDTSALIALSRLLDASHLPEVAFISMITLDELSVGPLVAKDEAERAARLTHVASRGRLRLASVRCGRCPLLRRRRRVAPPVGPDPEGEGLRCAHRRRRPGESPPSLHLGPSGPRGSMGSSPYLSSVTMRACQAHRASIPDSRPP
jgi:hypothetical protein